ncbi:IMPACT family protein [Saccharospirillum impatiens]|uniref:IMPACT family protein n=1 Tax=Saccharospirillum impatiens TaxID=169438 RepID=UPI00040A6BC2|nr:YigZ family protein [Saccharospirillum impatiens]
MSCTLKAPVYAELEVKKSRFLAWVEPVADPQAVQTRLAELRKQYADARHLCFAFYVSGNSGMSDDGEPSGTAGKPIFNVISHKHLVNVLAVVVRYFGGVKLGAGGLVRAYGGVISLALEQAEWVPVETMHPWAFTCPFALESELRRLLERYQLMPEQVEYSTGVQIEVTVPESQLSDLRRDFMVLAPQRSDLIERRVRALRES